MAMFSAQYPDKLGVHASEKTPAEASRLLGLESVNKAFGESYLRAMLKDSGGEPVRALTAYNHGPGNVANHLSSGKTFDMLKPEAHAYAAKVAAVYHKITGGESLFPGAGGDIEHNKVAAAKQFNAHANNQASTSSGQKPVLMAAAMTEKHQNENVMERGRRASL